MAQHNTLSLEAERLRGEAAALKSARDKKAQKTKKKSAKKKAARKIGTAALPAAENKVAESSSTGESGEFEQLIRDLVDSSEKEIAEHPMIALGIAFLLGIIAGRASKN